MNKVPLILVVEDDYLVRETLASVLENDGFTVDLAENGEEALRRMYQRNPDIVISDIRMPMMDGYELFRRMQNDRSLVAIPLIFISALAAASDLRQGMALGVADYITKPFDPPALCQAVRVRLRQKTRLNELIDSHEKVLTRYLPHEMRTPLNGVIGFADLMLYTAQTGEGLSCAETRDIGNQIMHSGQRLLKLTDNLMLLLELGRNNAEIMPFDPNTEWLPDTEVCLKSIAHMYGREEDLQIDLEAWSMAMSARHVSAVLCQLVDNGFKFSMPGTHVVITGSEVPEGYKITVTDRGRGMTNEQLAQTGVFIQHDRAKYEQQGLGLGLEIVRRFCLCSHVDLTLESRQGRGLKVELRFPHSRA
jgi:two-component system, sensor histidine kinase and response regulator